MYLVAETIPRRSLLLIIQTNLSELVVVDPSRPLNLLIRVSVHRVSLGATVERHRTFLPSRRNEYEFDVE